jgi:hypothetical protein
LLVVFVFNAAFYISYRVVDKETMYLPTYLIWALWAGVGYQWLLNWIESSGDKDALTHWLPRALIAGSVLFAVSWNWRVADLSNDWSARRRGETILRTVEPEALVLGWWDTVPVVEYLQLVEGWRPDVRAINRFLIAPHDLERLILHEIERRPVYVDDVPAPWLSRVETERAGPLTRLSPRSETQLTPHRSPSSSTPRQHSEAVAKNVLFSYHDRGWGSQTGNGPGSSQLPVRMARVQASQPEPADLLALGMHVLSLDL